MKANIYRIIFFVFVSYFYYESLDSFLNFNFAKYPSHISFLVPVVILLISIFLTPLVIGCGVFLFFKYPHSTRKDFWRYCFVYPLFFTGIICLASSIWYTMAYQIV